MQTSSVMLAMTSVTDALRNKKELLGTTFVSEKLQYDSRPSRQCLAVHLLVKVACCFRDSCFDPLQSFFPPAVYQALARCLFLKLMSLHYLSTHRFADSIRGMLKLILVLMLAGASLTSTWFTLTCLSRVTHLPSTAGG